MALTRPARWRERERERERERQTERQRERQTDRQRERDRETETERQRDREDRDRDGQRETERDRDSESGSTYERPEVGEVAEDLVVLAGGLHFIHRRHRLELRVARLHLWSELGIRWLSRRLARGRDTSQGDR